MKVKPERSKTSRLSQLVSRMLADTQPSEDNQSTQGLVTMILEEALLENASDVHLDPVPDGYQMRVRIDGALHDRARFEADQGRHLVRSFKSHAGIEPGYALRPEDGRSEFQVDGRQITVRIATMPSVLGEKLALRLLPPELDRLELHELGLSEEDYAQLKRAVDDTSGMILLSGPTGCGKTTTAYALLHELQADSNSIVTIEDPVEHILDGVIQVQVNEKQGLTFAEGVKGLLRLDPDILMMGEIRDALSARSALDAAASGHVFISTLHARDAAGTVTALRNFELADHEIAANLDLVAAQRLVRRLCLDCRKQGAPTPAERDWLRFHGQAVPDKTWHRTGCASCGQTGYRGRIGVFEVWRLNEDFSELILRHADERRLRQAIRQLGRLSLLEDDLRKVRQGLTTIEEMQRLGGLEFYLSGKSKDRPRRSAAGAGGPRRGARAVSVKAAA